MSDLYAQASDAVFWTITILGSICGGLAFLCWLADSLEEWTEPPDIRLDIVDFKPRDDVQ